MDILIFLKEPIQFVVENMTEIKNTQNKKLVRFQENKNDVYIGLHSIFTLIFITFGFQSWVLVRIINLIHLT